MISYVGNTSPYTRLVVCVPVIVNLVCWLYLMILAQDKSNFYKQSVVTKHSKSTYASVESVASYFADKTNQPLPLKNFTNF